MTNQSIPVPTTSARFRLNVRGRLMASGATSLAVAAMLAAPQQAQAQLSPTQSMQGTGTVVSGSASIAQSGTVDTVRVSSPEAVINWRPNDTTGTGSINFLPSGRRIEFLGDADFTVFNRIIPVNGAGTPVARLIELNGQIDSRVLGQQGGNVWFYSPGGILVGGTGVFNVGSLVLTTRDIDTTGGLFDAGGTIRFGANTTATTGLVRLDSGAQINANRVAVPGSSYVALVAPRIEQAGTINVRGATALVAAETVDIRINAGLFDINVTTGSGDPNGIVHTGTTGGPRDTSPNFEHRAYLVAVPKTQAMTMLLSGTVGFQDTLTLGFNNEGAIILSAGNNIAGGLNAGDAGASGLASISITDSVFRNPVDGFATNEIVGRPLLYCSPCSALDQPAGKIAFYAGGTLSAANRVDLSVGRAQQIFVFRDLNLLAAKPGIGGIVNLTVDGSGTPPAGVTTPGDIFINGLLRMDASTRGDEFVNGGAATAGTVSLTADAGTRIYTRFITMLANAVGGTDLSGVGQTGRGGTVRITASNNARIEAVDGPIDLQADGIGGRDVDGLPINVGGNGFGGGALVQINDGSITAPQGMSLSAQGLGGVGRLVSGNGSGGGTSVSISGNTAALTTNFVFMSAGGTGGGSSFLGNAGFVASADGGDGFGGSSFFTVTDNDSRVNFGFLLMEANGRGGVSTQPGTTGVTAGNGTGGGVNLSVTRSNWSFVSPNGAGAIRMSASGVGGDAIGNASNGGNGTGGNISLLTRLANLNSGFSLTAFSNGFGGVGPNISGNGQGGRITFSSRTSTLTADTLTLDASGFGGGAFNPNASFAPSTTVGGNGTGGTVDLFPDGSLENFGSIDANDFNLIAAAIGGDANPLTSATATPQGGSATGGRSRFQFDGVNITADRVLMDVSALGGSSGTTAGATGTATAGQANSIIRPSTNGSVIDISGTMTILATANARTNGGGRVGNLTGGTASIQLSQTTANVRGAIRFDASAGGTITGAPQAGVGTVLGGFARLSGFSSILNTPSLTLLAAATNAPNSGTAASGSVTGGSVLLGADQGSLFDIAGDILLNASATGGNAFEGAAAAGGSAIIQAGASSSSGPSRITAATTTVELDGKSGGRFGAASLTPARGGQFSLSAVGSGAIQARASLGQLAVNASGSNISTAALPDGYTGPIGGDATGGSIGLGAALNGVLELDDSQIFLEGRAAAGGTGLGGGIFIDVQRDGILDLNQFNVSLFGQGGTGIGTRSGGLGRGGRATFFLSGGTIDISGLDIAAEGIGGHGTDGFIAAASEQRPTSGGSGEGGSIGFFVFGSTFNAGTVRLTADARGGDGGDFDPTLQSDYYVPGSGGSGTGGEVSVSLSSGAINADTFELLARGRGGDGGRITGTGSGNLTLRGPATADPAGGAGTGGTARFTIAGGNFNFAPLLDASALGGAGGTALAGARGGDALGGIAETIVDDVDGGTLNVALFANAQGGVGGDGLHGAGGIGGNGSGGRVAVSTTGPNARATVSSTLVQANGSGGNGGRGSVSSAFAAVSTGFAGGQGGNGAGGEAALTAGGGEMLVNVSSGFLVAGTGGNGGNGANNPASGSIATFGGDGGAGGNGQGGTISLTGDGGSLSPAAGGPITLGAAANAGTGGAGGAGNVVTSVDPATGQTITSGGNGLAGALGRSNGGTARIVATSAAGSRVTLGDLDILVDGDVSGRVELIDDTDGSGLELGLVTVLGAGAANVTGNFPVSGSGVYMRSASGAMRLGGLDISTGGDVQFDAIGTGGFDVAGDVRIAADGLLQVTHADRPANAKTIDASSFEAVAGRIVLGNGTRVYGSGLLFLSAATDITFDELASDGGTIELGASGFITGNSSVSAPTAIANGAIRINSGFGTTIGTLDAGGDISVTGAGAASVTNLVSRSGSAFVSGTSLVIGSATTAAGFVASATTGDAAIDSLASGGLIDITAGRDAILGNLRASGGAAINVLAGRQINISGADASGEVRLDGSSITAAANGLIRAGGVLKAIARTGNVRLGPVSAGSIDIDALTGRIEFGDLATTGTVALDALEIAGNSITTDSTAAISSTNGIALTRLHSGGASTLAAANGAITIADLRGPAIDAKARSLDLTTTANSTVTIARATAGNAIIRGNAGNLTVSDAQASGNIDIRVGNGTLTVGPLAGTAIIVDGGLGVTLNGNQTASGLLDIRSRRTATINGSAIGATISVTSGDIVIGSNGRIGQVGTTTQTTLTNGNSTVRTFVGGNDTTAGYSLSAAEMLRLFGNNVTIVAPQVVVNSSTAAAPTAVIGLSRQPDLTIDAFTFNGASGTGGNLGTNGTLRIETPGFARVIGAAQLANANPGNRLTLVGQQSLEVILGQGSVRVTNGGALAGTLELVSQDVVVATASAISDIASASGDLSAIEDRLAVNDGVASDEGAISADAIRITASGVYIQNTGTGTRFGERRGYTAGTGGLTVTFPQPSSSSSSANGVLVINGRTSDGAGGFLTGLDAFPTVTVGDVALEKTNQSINGLIAGSTLNGCDILGAGACREFIFNFPEPDNPLIDEEDEESEQTGGESDPPGVLVDIRDVDPLPNEPLVDDPVTGAGNDDLWAPLPE